MKRIGLGLLLFFTLAHGAAANTQTDLEAAKEAVRSRDTGKLERLADKLQGDPLEIYPRYWLLTTQIDTIGDAQVRTFLQTFPGSLLADKLRGDWLKALGKAGRWEIFSAEYPALISPDTELECFNLQARNARQETEALTLAKRLWFSGKDMPESCGQLFDYLRQNQLLSKDDIWERARLGLEANNMALVRRMMALLPAAETLPLKQLDSVAANPALALKKQQLSLASRGSRELAMFALYRLARSDADLAAEYWNQMGKQVSEADRHYVWAQIAFNAARKHNPQALAWYREGAQARLDKNQLEWKVRAALRLQDWATVLATIDTMPAAQQSEPAWRYWKARALRQQNRILEANQILAPLSAEHHYYGLLAREDLGSVIETAAVRYKPSDSEIRAMQQLPSIQRALALYKMDWRSEATREWNWGMRGLEDQQLLATAELAARNNWYDRAIYAAERTVNVHDFSLRYVAPYRDVVSEYAKQVGLDDAWVFGLMRQESRFVQVARSGVGASGLMQLMPATARWVAAKLGIKHFQQGMVNEIGTNVQLGTYYLKTVQNSLGGLPVLATAAYNAGPGRARAWQANVPLEGAIYAETIPFDETRDYVKKVMANAVHYAKVFNHEALPLKTRLGTIPARGAQAATADDIP